MSKTIYIKCTPHMKSMVMTYKKIYTELTGFNREYLKESENVFEESFNSAIAIAGIITLDYKAHTNDTINLIF